jgi:deoxyguanosine kinase
MRYKYPFIVVEGTDGSGKSTLCDWISETFGYHKYKSIGGAFDKVKHEFDIDKVSIRERFSFLCGEAINNAFIVKQELQKGNSIIFDRYYFSTLVYCESLYPTISSEYKFLFDHLPKPDLVLFIQTNFENMLRRIKERGYLTLIEKKYTQEENFDILISNYMKYIDTKKIIIDNNKSIEFAKEQIYSILK